ncbi:cytochrome P450 [Corynespora cassiicola Philippines]|uniref:Cytochrome P450 n=1 Tax=Corynespora cassiicola Philippines TaxID=1448308 RepID=A0A2T2NYS5_CORCC|nr:cytochrome P450 [Corynespora cassiicola Philippines]
MLAVAVAILLPLFLLLISTAWCLACNYLIACKVGIPVIIVPISPENPVWMLLARHVVPILQYVPFGNGNFTRFCHVGWEFEEKTRAHQEFGEAIMLATPGKNWIYLCNADTIHDIVKRERQGEFARPVELLAMLDVFGPNISTMNGSDWLRQRKCTAASFNEQSNLLVWTESLRQGQQMLQYWKKNPHVDGLSTMAKDTRTFALDVLVRAAFGKSFDFYGARDKKTVRGPLSYRDALAVILENAILILAIGPSALKRLAFIPKLGLLSNAAEQFKQYMLAMFKEQAESAQGEKAQGNLITSLVRASVEDQLITQDEVIGNIFVFNFAGHDTTSHSLAFTLMLLAAHPEVQSWMAEEIRYIVGDDDVLEIDYSIFPKFVRTLAVLLETLRLYDPLMSIVKGTENQPVDLTILDKTIVVPPHTRVLLNLTGVHTHPRYWGSDSLEWRPSRWILETCGDGPVHDREQIVMPSHGAYIPWGEGNRSCPGKKFSQVEHVAAMVAMFHRHTVMPMQHDGESPEAARARAMDTLDDTGMMLLLQMLHPEKTPLLWQKRVC